MDPRQYGPEVLPHAPTVKRRLAERSDRPEADGQQDESRDGRHDPKPGERDAA